MRVVIVGNPNSGKTTLFNGLTKSNAHTGNWHGVTTNVLRGHFFSGNEKIDVSDLPGINSFNPITIEQTTAVDFLKNENYDLIINVIEGLRFDKAVVLTEELATLKKPMICFVNMYRELEKFGGALDLDFFRKHRLPVYAVDFTKKSDLTFARQLILEKRYTMVSKADVRNMLSAFKPPKTTFTTIDRLLTSRIFSLFCFTSVVLAALYLAFGNYGIGKLVGEFLKTLFLKLADATDIICARLGISEFVARLISEGIICGFGAVISFLPSVAVLNFISEYLEHSGIIARLSFILDGFLSEFGLNGRAVFTFLMGFGCTTIATTCANGLESTAMKRRVITTLPFISCSAKLTVYLYICTLFTGSFSALIVAAIYLCGLMFALAVCKISFARGNKEEFPLILELPVLRLNCFKNLLKPLINSIKNFIIKIVTVSVTVSVVVYLMSALSPHMEYLTANQADRSILAVSGGYVAALFKPINACDYKIGAAVIAGLFAKEAFISTLCILNFDSVLSLATSVSLVVFIAFYPPCVNAIAAVYKETNLLFAALMFVFQTLFAVAMSYLVYFLMTCVGFCIAIVTCSVLLIIFLSLRAFLKNKRYENLLRK